jgi:hypothetical protein
MPDAGPSKTPSITKKLKNFPITPNFFHVDNVFHNGYSFPGGST